MKDFSEKDGSVINMGWPEFESFFAKVLGLVSVIFAADFLKKYIFFYKIVPKIEFQIHNQAAVYQRLFKLRKC